MRRVLHFALHFLLGIALALGVLEALLRLLPVSTATLTDYYVDPMILGYPVGHHWRVSTGWDLRNPQVLHANNLGFAAERDFKPEPRALALVGDSFVEESMLDADERPDAQLERALGGARPVYALGVPGSSLLDHAERVRWATERLDIHDFVLVFAASGIRQSICGTVNVQGPCLKPGSFEPAVERRPPPDALKRVLRHSALAQYLFGQVKLDALRFVHKTFTRVAPATPSTQVSRADGSASAAVDVAFVDVVARTFLERVRPYQRGRLVLAVERGPAPDRDPQMAAERSRFIALMRAAGVTVIDAQPLFEAYSRRSPWKLEVGPYDAHMNAIAVRLLMREVARVLAGLPSQGAGQ